VTLADPRFATDATFTSGTDDTLPNKIAPSTGLRAQGFDRDQPLPVTVLNSILATHGDHLVNLADVPSLSWTPQDAYVNADVIAGASPNRNEADDPAIFYSAHERLILKTPGGGTGVTFHSRARGQGLLNAGAGDTSPFTACADSGATTGAAILTAREQSTRIVAIDQSSGTARQSIDYGATWSAAGTYGGFAGPECGGYFDGAWHAANAGTPKQIFSSSTLSGAWTQTTLTADADTYYRFIAANDGLVDVVGIFLPGTCTTTTQLLVKPQGSAWQVVTVAGAGASSGWRGDYNAATGVILIADVTGRCYASFDGLSWTLVYTEAQGIYDVAAHGAGFVLSCVTEDFTGPATTPHLRFLAPGLAGAWASSRIPVEGYAVTYSRYHLIRHRGRVYAGRVYVSGSDRLEWWESDLNPAGMLVLA
jgi:hypothetical protein